MRRTTTPQCAAALAMAMASNTPGMATADEDTSRDYHSFSNPDQLKVEHVNLALEVDFDKRTLEGAADLKVRRLDSKARTLVLDTRELTIQSVWITKTGGRDEQLKYK